MATTLGVGSLLLGTALVAGPAATAAPPVTTVAAAPAATAGVAPLAAGPRTALVNAWYSNYLLRWAPEDPGSRYWVERLRTVPPAQVLTELLATDEYVTQQIAGYYDRYLGRAPDAGAQHWVRGVRGGSFPLEWVEQNVLASPEHVARAGEVGGPPAVVRDYYATILQRTELRSGEEGYWVGRLAGTSPLQVVREIWYSSEAVNRRVDQHYDSALGRGPSAGERGYWYGQEVASDITTSIRIASSPEAVAYASTYYGYAG